MSAPTRFWESVGSTIKVNQGCRVTHEDQTCANVYVSQDERQRDHWNVILNISSHPSPFQLSAALRACDARHLAQALLSAADLMEAEQAKHLASVAPAEVAP